MKRSRLRRLCRSAATTFCDRDEDRGSIIILAPAIAVVAITLAGLLIDLNYLYMAKTQLQNRVEVAATEAANTVNKSLYYQNGTIEIDRNASAQFLWQSLNNHQGHGYRIIAYNFLSSASSICVNATASVSLPAFAGILSSIAPTITSKTVAYLPNPVNNQPVTIPNC
ncbi:MULTISPECIES: Tad domain-containing protein [Acidithrix]|uniref:Putative Flp pilus-assembly TadG-like N-terminal domain-containing protein n=1 Tax=Acidithrix ferrooxidans TaxID=1280514 RepID=A0A0D8HEV2_9ACTN|nr:MULTISPECIES: Tad domain-containing protein [Acidithrix]KJF16490.1 hypothetical protein AXFE_26550 [Acidithrix ferrooxidans]